MKGWSSDPSLRMIPEVRDVADRVDLDAAFDLKRALGNATLVFDRLAEFSA
jgi:hypothetical protein